MNARGVYVSVTVPTPKGEALVRLPDGFIVVSKADEWPLRCRLAQESAVRSLGELMYTNRRRKPCRS